MKLEEATRLKLLKDSDTITWKIRISVNGLYQQEIELDESLLAQFRQSALSSAESILNLYLSTVRALPASPTDSFIKVSFLVTTGTTINAPAFRTYEEADAFMQKHPDLGPDYHIEVQLD